MITMPRKKSDQVIEHRVTLGDWEREQLKDAKDYQMVKNVGIGVGVASLGIGGTYVAYKIGKSLYEWGDDVIDFLKEQPVNEKGDKGPPRWVQILISGP